MLTFAYRVSIGARERVYWGALYGIAKHVMCYGDGRDESFAVSGVRCCTRYAATFDNGTACTGWTVSEARSSPSSWYVPQCVQQLIFIHS